MKTATEGDRVKVVCTGRLENKGHLGATEKRTLVFEIGRDQVLPGIEYNIRGMAVGEKKSFTVPPEKGYGPRRSDLIKTLDRNRFPSEINLETGKYLQIQYEDGRVEKAQIAAVEDDRVILDANHPLAGETLRFDVEIVSIF